QDAYKFRFIFKTPKEPFEMLSLRMQMLFTTKTTSFICWGGLHNVTINVFPFELATIEGVNNSVQVINALDLYRGTNIQFNFNTTAFKELEYFEVSFSSWNASDSLKGIQFEQIRFHLTPITGIPSQLFLLILGTIGLFGLSIVYPQQFRNILLLLFGIILLMMPLTIITQVQNILTSLPEEKEEGVTRFTFFNRVYERRDLGNGYFSLQMVKDLSTAFELQALSGTGASVVYPKIEQTIEDSEVDLQLNETEHIDTTIEEESTSPLVDVAYPYLQPNFAFSDITGSPSWWNSNYQYVKQVRITAGSEIGTNYTIQVDLDTQTLVSASKLRADCKDLRVVYYNETDSTWYELNRVVLKNNTQKTAVFFKLQKTITASSSDHNYAIYYGFRSGDPGNPPSDTSKIFIDYDDFSSGNLNSYITTSWAATTDGTKPTNIGWWTNNNIASGSNTAYGTLERSNLVTNNTQVFVMYKAIASTSSSISLRTNIGGPNYLYLDQNSTAISLRRYTGSTIQYTSISGGYSTALWYFYKFQIVGDTLKGKRWATGNNEPSAWTLSHTASGLPSSGSLTFYESTTFSYMKIGVWAVMVAVETPPTITIDSEENDIPEITEITVTNDDEGEIHSQRKDYTFRVNATDLSGYTDIEYVQLNFTVNGVEFSVGYNRTDSSYSEIWDPLNNMSLSSASGTGSVNDLSVTFDITFDWDFPTGTGIPIEAFVNDSLAHSDNENSISTYSFNHDIVVSSFTSDDSSINPNNASDLTFTGIIRYKGTSYSVPDAQIDQVSIFRDPANPTTGDETTISSSVASFSVSADSESTVGNYSYYPVVDLAGDGATHYLNNTNVEVAVDCVKITAITISSHKYNDGSRFWEDNDASDDEIWITVSAVWNYTSNPYAGEVYVGYVGNTGAYGATTGLIRNDVEENPPAGTIQERDDITVGSAIEGVQNVYGPQVYIDPTLAASLPDIGWDNAPPTIEHNPATTSELSDYLYYDTSSTYGYYSDNMGASPTDFIIGGTASDEGSGIASLTDNTDFGGNPSMGGSYSSWIYTYEITSGDTSYGTFVITYTVTDYVGNTNTTEFEFRIDNTNPTIAHSSGTTSESSDYLYYEGSTTYGYYSDNMDSVDTDFIVGGTASDGGAGLLSIEDDTTFGNDLPRGGTLTSWTFTYEIDQGDAGNGTFTVTYIAIDRVNNSNTVSFEFREDNTDPTITHNPGTTSEASNYLYYDGSSAYGYYSDNMGVIDTNFVVGGTASDSGAGLVSIVDNTSFGNDPSRGGSLASWSFTYVIDQGDKNNGTFRVKYTATDFVNNTAITIFTFREDNNDPTITHEPSATNETSAYLYYDTLSNYGYYSDNMEGTKQTFNVGGTASDGGAGLQYVQDNTIFGDNPSYSGSLTAWTFAYTIDSGDSSFGSFTVNYIVNDKVGNTKTTSFTFYEDNTAPNIDHDPSTTSEASDFLFYDSASGYGYYSDNMGTADTNFIVGGTASDDGGVGLLSIEDDTSFGNNPPQGGSLISWTFTYEIDQGDKNNGTFLITYTAKDHVGNTNTTSFQFREDNTNPTITHNPSATSESSDYLFYGGSAAYGYYSDNMGPVDTNFIIGGTASDGGVGLLAIEDDTFFGNNPPRGGSLTSWTFTYAIDQGDKNNGTFTVTYKATDKVNNSNIVTFQFREDNDNPSATIDYSHQYETAYGEYLYWDASNSKWWYGVNMGLNEANFTVGIDASDGTGAGLKNASAASDLGGTLAERTDETEDTQAGRTYDVPVVDINSADIGPNINLVLTITDQVGNINNSCTILISRDNTNPTIGHNPSTTSESSPYLYYDGSSAHGYYSDNMELTTVTFIVGGTANDADAGMQLVTDNTTTFGDNPSRGGSLSSWTFSYTIDSDDSSEGTFNIIYTATDNVGNNGTTLFEFRVDNTDPTNNHDPSTTSESSNYLYYDNVAAYGYYSNNMGSTPTDFVVGGTASDGGAGLLSIIDNTTFGTDPSNSGSLTDWIFTYSITSGDSAQHTFVIMYTATDRVGNTKPAYFEFKEDNTIPAITHNPGATSESSPYLYYEGSAAYGYYSDNMGSVDNDFIIGGTASDGGVGLLAVEDDTAFGNNPPRGGSLTSWTFTYAIDQGDKNNGTFTVTYKAIDRVNNSNIITFEFREDNTDPTIGISTSTTTEDSPYLYYDGSSTHGYYSDNMDSIDTNFVVGGTASDGGAGLLSIEDDTTFGNDLPRGGTLTSWTFTYEIDQGDAGNGTFSVTYNATDNVGNFFTTSFEFREDNTDPTIDFSSSTTTEASAYLYYDGSSTHGYYSDNMGPVGTDFVIGGTASDGGADLLSIVDNTTFGKDPGMGGTLSSWTFTYNITQGDFGNGIFRVKYTATDLVNNTAIMTFEFREDNDDPSAISIADYYDNTDNNGDGYLPSKGNTTIQAFYDDSTFNATVYRTEDGSGIYILKIKSNTTGTYGDSVTDGSNVSCALTAETINTIWYQVVDNVGNNATSTFSPNIDVYYSTETPTGMDIDIIGTGIWTLAAPSYAWISDSSDITSGELFLGNGGDTEWSISMDSSGDWGNSGPWRVVFSEGWGIASPVNDSSPPFSSTDLSENYHSNTGAIGSITVDIINQCGLSQRVTLITTADTTGPTMASITASGNDGSPVAGWDQDGSGFSINPSPIADGGSGINTVVFDVDDNSPDAYNSSDDPFAYPVDIGDDGDYTFWAVAVDKVGNYGLFNRSYEVHVDTINPKSITTNFILPDYSPNWYDQGETGFANYSISFNEVNVYSIQVVCNLNGDQASDAGQGQSSPFYSIINLDPSYTDGVTFITITIRDKAGRTNTTFTGINNITLDDTAPSATIDYTHQYEVANGQEDYIYWNGSIWWYGDDMGSSEAKFTVGVNTDDGTGVGLNYAIAAANLGGSPEDRTDDTEDTEAGRTYDVPVVNITNADSWSGSLLITVYDLLGNAGTTSITINRDIINPSSYWLILDADPKTIGYAPNTNYYDDPTVDFTVGGAATDGTGSGLPGSPYGFSYDGAAFVWQSEITKQYTMTEANHTVDLKVIDHVGNEGDNSTQWVIVDTDSPEGFTLDWDRADGAPFDNAFFDGSSIYFDSQQNDFFTVEVLNNGDINNSGFWKIEWDKNNTFGVAINDT
ncbi:MAG: hypothetical protein ACFFC6_13530, partial [Promethearchaeota archaeon]